MPTMQPVQRWGVPPLNWDDTVVAYAQNYANWRIGDCNLVHSSMQEYGENHAWSSADLSSMETVKMWVDEKVNYDYKSNSGGLEQLSLCRMC
ncbi:basic form of pathogenesis-related protein 1 [Quercus suber]|uniref:Basic form of pathogenesis-related protein 1 n=1 Tax=Quercus suber TaxID=58331 RepID=A0AAW0JZX6_QUESU|nr:basic form of pathogenesis-related protein 1 [Quercus suber]